MVNTVLLNQNLMAVKLILQSVLIERYNLKTENPVLIQQLSAVVSYLTTVKTELNVTKLRHVLKKSKMKSVTVNTLSLMQKSVQRLNVNTVLKLSLKASVMIAVTVTVMADTKNQNVTGLVS